MKVQSIGSTTSKCSLLEHSNSLHFHSKEVDGIMFNLMVNHNFNVRSLLFSYQEFKIPGSYFLHYFVEIIELFKGFRNGDFGIIKTFGYVFSFFQPYFSL